MCSIHPSFVGVKRPRVRDQNVEASTNNFEYDFLGDMVLYLLWLPTHLTRALLGSLLSLGKPSTLPWTQPCT